VKPRTPIGGEAAQIHELEPREQAGSETIRRFDYQFIQAADACLDLLDRSEGECVYCEWHDDFVVEHAAPTCCLYAFYQVKTKKAALGAWTLSDVFGVGSRRKAKGAIAPPRKDSIALHLFEHYESFPDQCVKVALVTNAAFHEVLVAFINALHSAPSASALGSDDASTFEWLLECYREWRPSITEQEFFGFLRKLVLVGEVGTVNPRTFDTNYQLLTGRVHKLSEIPLRYAQATAIARDLVSLVRRKSIEPVAHPISDESLRLARGIAPTDVLSVLALSPQGYKILRESGATGRDAVRALSRFQRLCDVSGIPADVAADMCSMKVRWDMWERGSSNVLSLAVALELKIACDALLADHAGRGMNFGDMSAKAGEIAEAFSDRIASAEPLTRDLVLGYAFALASTRAN